MTATDGDRLIAGRYLLISEVGRGAMGVVWLARDERLGRTVAVKELRAGVGLSGTQVQHSYLRARREARIAGSLNHPHAVALYDVVEHEDRPYLVMEYVPSRSLAEVLTEHKTLAPARVAEIGAQTAAALVAAHKAGIVHRDIKPGNILLAESGEAKLTDFGISRAIGDVTVTGTGEMLGTPAYIAPEVAQGQPASAASDVFSLGATLYAAVEGEPPFGTGPSAIALLLRISNGELRPPERIGPITGTLLWMLRNDPADRPSMEQARLALRDVVAASSPDTGTDTGTLPMPEALAVTEPVVIDTRPEPAESDASDSGSGDGAGAAVVAASAAEQPPSTPTPESTTTSTNPRRRLLLPWWAWLAVVAVVIAGIIAALVASSGPSGSKTTLPPAASSTHTTRPTTAASPAVGKATTSATSKASASTTPSSTPSASGSATASATTSAEVAAQLTAAITDYYKLVPGDLNQAWGYMTADYQQNHAGGMSGYRSFWDQIKSVSLTDLVAQPPSTVTVTINYVYLDGETVQERTSFGLVFQDGIWKIASSSVESHSQQQ